VSDFPPDASHTAESPPSALPWYAASGVVGVLTVVASVALAAVAPNRVVGGTHELLGFALWSIPLGFAVARLGQRWSFARLAPASRAAAASATGLLLGVAWTLIGWILVGGYMLAWDFPVFYCWALGAALGMLYGAWAQRSIRFAQVAFGVCVAVVPLSALAWQSTRPQPAVVIVYRESGERDAAQYVLDSVLSTPHKSGVGREIRWPYSSYSRTRYDGHVAALIVLHDADDRAPLRRAVAGHPLVLMVIDTTVSRGE
jgi:hypothetical protein